MFHGWYLVAYERELQKGTNCTSIGLRHLMIIYLEGTVRAFDLYCPHRGANLSPGKLSKDHVVCPFHGRKIGLGIEGDDGFQIKQYRCLLMGGLVFVLLTEEHENGLTEFLTSLDETHYFVPGFKIGVTTSPDVIIENAFDRLHFKQVHFLDEFPELSLEKNEHGQLVISSRFKTSKENPWQSNDEHQTDFDFLARVFSPALAITKLTVGERSYWVITAATPDETGISNVRVSVIAPAQPDGSAPDPSLIRLLLRDSRASIEQDVQIWENLSPVPIKNLVPGEDQLLQEYYDFCRRFE